MIEQDGAALLFGEISSASSLTIMQVAERNKKVFFSLPRPLRRTARQELQPLSLHRDIPNTVMVNAVGTALKQQGMVKGKKFVTLTADYIFGHDLEGRKGLDANGATLIGDELIATDVTDFSPVSPQDPARGRQSPTWSAAISPATSATNLVKQYAEFGLPYPLVGFNLNTGDAWAMGEKGKDLFGTWPTVWYHTLDNPASKAFVETFTKRVEKYGKPPENHAWIDITTMKFIAQAIEATKSTDVGCADRAFRERDPVRHHEEPQGLFPRLGSPAGADTQEAVALHRKAKRRDEGQVGHAGARRRRAHGERNLLESIYPTKTQNPCEMNAAPNFPSLELAAPARNRRRRLFFRCVSR